METLTVTLHHEHARRLLEDLQLLGAITIKPADEAAPQPRQRTFNALSVSTKGFKFNREEANER